MNDYKIDTHVHTIVSGHAYNTMDEMIDKAIEKGLDVLCITEHGPSMVGSAHPYYFTNMRVLTKTDYQKKIGNFYIPEYLKVIHGMEANILDYTGKTDYEGLGDDINNIKYIIASFHKICCEPGTFEENTNAYIGAIKKPYVSVLGHIDDGNFDCDYEKIVKCAKEYNCLIEVNNSSNSPSSFRLNSKKNTLEYLQLCKDNEVMIILNSDAHYKEDILNFSNIIPLLEKVSFPEELIINNDKNLFLSFIEKKYEQRLKMIKNEQC